jgi:hypothetical protein
MVTPWRRSKPAPKLEANPVKKSSAIVSEIFPNEERPPDFTTHVALNVRFDSDQANAVLEELAKQVKGIASSHQAVVKAHMSPDWEIRHSVSTGRGTIFEKLGKPDFLTISTDVLDLEKPEKGMSAHKITGTGKYETLSGKVTSMPNLEPYLKSLHEQIVAYAVLLAHSRGISQHNPFETH